MGLVPCKPNFIDPAVQSMYRPVSPGPVRRRAKWSQASGLG